MTTAVAIGDRLPERRFVVAVDAMKVFSLLMRDPNPVHFDPDFVRSLGLGDRPVNQGTITMGYPITVVLEWIGDPARLLTFRCRFLGTLLAGDEAVAGGAVTGIETVDGRTIATLELWLERPGGDRVVEGGATVDATLDVANATF
jgi:3-hydroxybutyryl-CoA dehydratase